MKMNQEIMGYDFGEAQELLSTVALGALAEMLVFEELNVKIEDFGTRFFEIADAIRAKKAWVKENATEWRSIMNAATKTRLLDWSDEKVEEAISKAQKHLPMMEIFDEAHNIAETLVYFCEKAGIWGNGQTAGANV